jgi:predicted membrane protein
MKKKKNKLGLFAVLAIILMTGSGVLLERTVNVLSSRAGAPATIVLLLISVSVFTVGTAWLGQTVSRHSICRSRPGSGNSIVFALLLIAAGLLLLGFNTGFLPGIWRDFFFSWPMLVFVFGAVELCRFRFFNGVILAATGKFFLIAQMAAVYPDDGRYEQFVATFWPVLVIVFGLLILFSIVFKPGCFRFDRHSGRGYWDDSYAASPEANSEGKIDYRFIFSGTEQVILDPVFKGGTIELILGGMELDLRHTSLREGETVLYVKALLGGLVVKAPAEWHIEIRSRAILGGVDDSREKNYSPDPAGKLIIVAKCVLGGVAIKPE